MGQVIITAAHCAKLDHDAVLGILAMAVDGADDRTLRAWLSTDLGIEGEALDSWSVLKVVVDLLGERWGTLRLEARQRLLEIGARAAERVDRYMATRLHAF